MTELIKPNVTGEYYRLSDAIRILNHAQANYYLQCGVPLLDIYASRGMTVYVFHKESSFPHYQEWNRRKNSKAEETSEKESGVNTENTNGE